MLPLRPYQARAITDARRAYREGARAILIVAPTGAGKSKVATAMIRDALTKPDAAGALVIAHREELLRQMRDRLIAEGIPRVGIVAPWAPLDVGAPAQVASVQTLAAMARKGKALPRARIVVFDESHHIAPGAAEWMAVAETYRESIVLGFTATPERGDGSPMGKSAGGLFDALVTVASIRELQETVDERTGRAILVPCITFAPELPTRDLARDPVVAYQAETPGERAFCFCAGVAHAEEVAASFRAHGVPAATIHVDTPWPLRVARLDAFRTQSTKPLREAGSVEDAPLVLCNVYALTEGVDVPEASVCILARRIGNAGMQMQAVGRVLRSAPGKTRAVFLDLCGNVHAHGLPEADRVFSLDGQAICVAGEKSPRICTCRGGHAFSAWRVTRDGQRVCPVCGIAAPAPKPVRVSPRELLAMGIATPPETRTRALAMMCSTAVAQNYRVGWVFHRYLGRFGVEPSRAEIADAMRAAALLARGVA